MFSHKNPEFISQKFGEELESCNEWLVDNKLSVHFGKTKSILFSARAKIKNSI